MKMDPKQVAMEVGTNWWFAEIVHKKDKIARLGLVRLQQQSSEIPAKCKWSQETHY